VANIRVPVLIFAGNTDGIAPVNSVKAMVKLLTNAHEVRFEIVPGGHLGMLTGRAARGTTWVTMDEWIEQYSTPDDRPARASAKKARAKKPVAPRPPAKKKPVPRTPKPADEVAPDRSAIGSNRERRFASASSRNLARKP
jgi:polyhydroxyalkanoate synthase